ncbi:MAG: nucleoside triphosphate pyrophosphohydrolase [Armatimonadota bacterium]|nr:nucleoside triphosphate pyrophosphohydrolase [Armatimonadota bacterium]MCX7778292.1 nucleoside triphosphate pyrophosphohydrolase [Armatimonadota bacterium]MDW8026320.1 nucleoside triphosphate pyrophosphohydrolase [Armatimonadota bacterium]
MKSTRPKDQSVGELFEEIVGLVARLRSQNGCPWDREQTHESIKRCAVEETYEVVQAIESGNMKKLCEELGDLLLQVVFHAQMASEENHFSILEVLDGLRRKLISRHPHVFGDARAETSEQVLAQWHAIKLEERSHSECPSETLMADLPLAMPALMLAEEVQKRASTVGFDWDNAKEAFSKVREEVEEFSTALNSGDEMRRDRLKAELGDLLFSIVNVARLLKLDAEDALRGTVLKFIRRFNEIERRAKELGVDLSQMSLREMDAIWDEVKSTERE